MWKEVSCGGVEIFFAVSVLPAPVVGVADDGGSGCRVCFGLVHVVRPEPHPLSVLMRPAKFICTHEHLSCQKPLAKGWVLNYLPRS